MNKYQHAHQSAIIFGGESKDYLAIHELIDSNKVVSPSIFGRFFLHHYDVGGYILEHVFGKEIKGVEVKKILLQHLFEDYGKVIFFKDWVSSFDLENLPKLLPTDRINANLKTDSRTRGLSLGDIDTLDNFFFLRNQGIDLGDVQKTVYDDVAKLSVFGHALGADLAVKMLGEKFSGFWTGDVVTGYLNALFGWEGNRDRVATLLDFEVAVLDQPWMHSPEGEERLDPERIKSQIESFELPNQGFLDYAVKYSPREDPPKPSFRPNRRPCNYD